MEVLPVLGFVVLVLVVGFSVVWQIQRTNTVLERWAAAIGCRILQRERCYFNTGPFGFIMRGQQVYRVVVENAAGATRSGWVRCGHWLVGMWVDAAVVRWDEPGEFGEPSPMQAAAKATSQRTLLVFVAVMVLSAAVGLAVAVAVAAKQ